MRRGTLLKNYAHVFAVMMRLRQLCCHRTLLPIDWHEVNFDELDEMLKNEAMLKAAQNGVNEDNGGLPEEQAKRMREMLRDLIISGMSDECSICLGEFRHPVITPCSILVTSSMD